MMSIKMTSLLLAGVLSAMSVGIFSASGDGADATGTQSGSIGGSTMAPNNTLANPRATKTLTAAIADRARRVTEMMAMPGTAALARGVARARRAVERAVPAAGRAVGRVKAADDRRLLLGLKRGTRLA